ncbi:5829_t:CDS:2 [Paraglomus brasilianum]|uniref:5829_t:CDS:1 n=1 Tax=Paraglomus brasilianum TaxID=144538 RepID=A0A9N9FX46_9GLOM|nr:5829_t:CDS:2 [Paraglomus brasilianum]
MGEPLMLISSIVYSPQKAHSRYFIQRLVLGFGKYDRSIDLKLAHTKDHSTRFETKGHDQFDGNNTPVRGNDMEPVNYFSAGPLVISQARTKGNKPVASSSRQTPTTELVSLFCLVDGESTIKAFAVRIDKNEFVSDLRKKEMAHHNRTLRNSIQATKKGLLPGEEMQEAFPEPLLKKYVHVIMKSTTIITPFDKVIWKFNIES